MPRSVQFNLPPAPLQSLSDADAGAESSRKSLTDWQDIPARALGRAGVSQKAAALAMGKSESWLSRALKGLEKLGWSDIGAIEDPQFWSELLHLVADFHEASFGDNPHARRDAEVGRRIREALEMCR